MVPITPSVTHLSSCIPLGMNQAFLSESHKKAAHWSGSTFASQQELAKKATWESGWHPCPWWSEGSRWPLRSLATLPIPWFCLCLHSDYLLRPITHEPYSRLRCLNFWSQYIYFVMCVLPDVLVGWNSDGCVKNIDSLSVILHISIGHLENFSGKK